MEYILTRRSIRRYTDQPVSEEVVTQLLKAAMAAPSAKNMQPWHFVVVRDRASLASIAAASPYAGMTKRAQVAIVICADSEIDPPWSWWVQDCSAATENVLLAANELGLGAVWLGFYPLEDRIEKVRTLLGLPDHIVPFSVIPLGYPAEQQPPADRFDPQRIHFDRW
jgi:nitroreductase